MHIHIYHTHIYVQMSYISANVQKLGKEGLQHLVAGTGQLPSLMRVQPRLSWVHALLPLLNTTAHLSRLSPITLCPSTQDAEEPGY